MPFTPAKKATLLIPHGMAGNIEVFHLHIILTDACKDGLHLLAPITSIRKERFHDPTCVIQAGEHPFIKHESYLAYRLLKIVAGRHIKKCVAGWVFKIKEPVSDILYNRICDGMEPSEFTPLGMKKYYTENE